MAQIGGSGRYSQDSPRYSNLESHAVLSAAQLDRIIAQGGASKEPAPSGPGALVWVGQVR